MAAAGMHDMTQGSLRGHILRIAGFICVSMILQILYSLVDLYWVGQLGSNAIAAVSLGSSLMMVMMAGAQTLAVGTVALIAPAAGRKDTTAVTAGAAQATAIAVTGGLLFLGVGFALMGPFARAVAADETTARLTVAYLQWFVPSLCLQFLLTSQSAALRALGNMKLATATQMSSLALNFVLAPLLVLGWPFGVKLGVAGAGLATFLATLAGSLFLTLKLARSEGPLRFPLGKLRPDFPVWRRILLSGLPAGAEFMLMAAYLLLINTLAARFGADAQAGFGVGMRWLHVFFMPGMSLSFAAAAVAGQNYGARQFDRVRGTFREVLALGAGVMLVAMLLSHVAPAWLVGRLSSAPGVIEAGSDFLRIISWNLLASAVIFACSGLFQGLGNTLPALLSSGTRIVTISALAVWLSRQPGFHLQQLWMASVATTLLQAVLCALFLRREFRNKLEPVVPNVEPETSVA